MANQPIYHVTYGTWYGNISVAAMELLQAQSGDKDARRRILNEFKAVCTNKDSQTLAFNDVTFVWGKELKFSVITPPEPPEHRHAA